jgi:hypothetical protein
MRHTAQSIQGKKWPLDSGGSQILSTQPDGQWTLSYGDVIVLYIAKNSCDSSIYQGVGGGEVASWYWSYLSDVGNNTPIQSGKYIYMPTYFQVVKYNPGAVPSNEPVKGLDSAGEVKVNDPFYLRVFLASGNGQAVGNTTGNKFDTSWNWFHGTFLANNGLTFYLQDPEKGNFKADITPFTFQNVGSGGTTSINFQNQEYALQTFSPSGGTTYFVGEGGDAESTMHSESQSDAIAFTLFPWLCHRPRSLAARQEVFPTMNTSDKYSMQLGNGFLYTNTVSVGKVYERLYTNAPFQSDDRNMHIRLSNAQLAQPAYGSSIDLNCLSCDPASSTSGWIIPAFSGGASTCDISHGAVQFADNKSINGNWMCIPAYKQFGGWGGKVSDKESMYIGDPMEVGTAGNLTGVFGDSFHLLAMTTPIVDDTCGMLAPVFMFSWPSGSYAGELTGAFQTPPPSTTQGIGLATFEWFTNEITFWQRIKAFFYAASGIVKIAIALIIVIMVLQIVLKILPLLA